MVDSEATLSKEIGCLWVNPNFRALRTRLEQRIEQLIEKMVNGRKEESMRENAARVKELKNVLKEVESAFKQNQ